METFTECPGSSLQPSTSSPAARDHRTPNQHSFQARGGTKKGEQLQNFVEHRWATPRSRDRESSRTEQGNPAKDGIPLSMQSRRWHLDPTTPDGPTSCESAPISPPLWSPPRND